MSIYAEAPARVHALMRTCRDQPMDLADACLVHRYEQEAEATRELLQAFTTDSDFHVYRTSDGDALRALRPTPA